MKKLLFTLIMVLSVSVHSETLSKLDQALDGVYVSPDCTKPCMDRIHQTTPVPYDNTVDIQRLNQELNPIYIPVEPNLTPDEWALVHKLQAIIDANEPNTQQQLIDAVMNSDVAKQLTKR